MRTEYDEDKLVDPSERHHRRRKEAKMLMVRNVLNTIFMIGAIVGVVYTLKGERTIGIYIVCASMVLKFVESALRLLKL